ncbi:hypothetical protein C0993_011450 [Termitomyces sp. T159_Od127]|nr:hypothetical protein C0993_011450 [Termitomyces sp. T159_Od127]
MQGERSSVGVAEDEMVVEEVAAGATSVIMRGEAAGETSGSEAEAKMSFEQAIMVDVDSEAISARSVVRDSRLVVGATEAEEGVAVEEDAEAEVLMGGGADVNLGVNPILSSGWGVT